MVDGTAKRCEEFTSLVHSHVSNLKVTGTKALGCVPWREDKHPSFSADLSKAIWYDLARKEGGGVKEFKQRLGLNGAGQHHAHKIVATYDYRDESGTLLFQVVRYEPKDFRQRRPGVNGKWRWNLNGTRRVLYRLPQLLMADTAYLVEGEKDAERLWALGLLATTNPQGAGKWREEYSQALAGKQVVILPDNDELGEQQALQVARSLLPLAAAVKIVRLPGLPPKGDVSDWLAAGHTKEELVAIVQATLILKAEDLGTQPNPTSGTVNEEAEDGELPTIRLNNIQLRDAVDQAVRALEQKNTPPSLFKRGDGLARVRHDAENHPVVHVVTESALRERLTRCADFIRVKQRGDISVQVRVSPTRELAETILALPTWPFPSLTGVVECPVLRPDGSVLAKAGYDPVTHLYYEPTHDGPTLAIPEAPSQAQAREALAFLREELLADFPFCEKADTANMLACLLTPIMRPAINGCVPLCLLDKPSPGSGATLLADLVATIATGQLAAKVTAPATEEEWRKKLTALLVDGSPVVVFDNIEDGLASSNLSAVLTTPIWKDRILGQTATITLPVRQTWIATANNIALRGDLARRSYRVRIDAQTERPWERDEFKHADLLAWTRENRGRLLSALLVVARAWFVAGQPQAQTPKVGGFDQWTRVCGGIITYAGVEGFLKNLDSLYSIVDEEAQQWCVFFAAWHECLGEQPVTVAELAGSVPSTPRITEALPESLPWSEDKEASFRTRLGKALKKRASRIYNGYRLERLEDNRHAKVATWRVRRLRGMRGMVPITPHVLDTKEEPQSGADENVSRISKNIPRNPPHPPQTSEDNGHRSNGARKSAGTEGTKDGDGFDWATGKHAAAGDEQQEEGRCSERQ